MSSTQEGSLAAKTTAAPGAHCRRDPADLARLLPLLVGLLLVPVVALWLVPRAPTCLSRRLLDLPCPGCGLGRAIVATMHLDLRAALAYYPPVLPLVLAYLVAVAAVSARLIGRTLPRQSTTVAMVLGLGVMLAVFGNWVFRLMAQQ